MKAVVFGGSGFIGSHVADALADRGHAVTVYDLRPSAHLRPDQTMVEGDILDGAAVRRILQGCTYVYHFAGLADIDEASAKPLETVEKNVKGTAVLLDAAAAAGVERFVFASTVYVYSFLGGFYRASKQACELYVEEYQKRFSLDYTILRFGTIYGPRADERNSIHRYLRQALSEKRIRFAGSDQDVREYVHVRDAARLSVDILADTYRNQAVIISGHHPMRAIDLLRMIVEMLGRDVTVEYAASEGNAHYAVTPYSFAPGAANKLIATHYVDLGQGLLECLHEIYAELRSER